MKEEMYVILLAAVVLCGAMTIYTARTVSKAKRHMNMYLNQMMVLHQEVKARQKSSEEMMDAMDDKILDTMDAMDELKSMLMAAGGGRQNEEKNNSSIQE